VLFRLFRPKAPARPELDAERPSQPELGRVLVDIVIARFPRRIVELVMDGAYASSAWQGLPERVTVTTRMRANAAVHALAPPATGKRGRPALKGGRLASLAALANSAVFVPITITSPSGRERTAYVHELICLWYRPFHTRAIKVLLIRNPGTTDGFDVALASTDTPATATVLIARYDSRWTIETCNQEAKAHGVGDARNRVEKAVQRTVPFGFLTITITIAWYQLHGNPETDLAARRRTAPWYRQKTTISYTDMLAALRRELIRHEFWAQAHQMTTTPELTQPQLPPALTAA
jgi:hypothetical protein